MRRTLDPLLTLASRFFRWWLSELRACVPQRLYRLLGARRPLVIVEFGNKQLRVRLDRGEGGAQEIGHLNLTGSNPRSIGRTIAELIAGAGPRRHDTVVCVAADEVLRRTVQLPLEAAENLREVIVLELDRLTPFKPSDPVCFDYHVLETDRVAARIRLELVATPRRVVAEAQGLIQACGLDARRVGVFAAFGAAKGRFMNLADAHAGGDTEQAGWLVASGLCGLAVLLAAVAFYIPIQQMQQSLAAYEARLAESRAEVAAVERLRSDLAETLEGARFLSDWRQRRPAVVAVLDEVTRLLGDDTWLLDFRIRDDELVISGYSTAASALVAVLEASDMLADVRFGAPVTPDPMVGQERFSLTARIVGPLVVEAHQTVEPSS